MNRRELKLVAIFFGVAALGSGCTDKCDNPVSANAVPGAIELNPYRYCFYELALRGDWTIPESHNKWMAVVVSLQEEYEKGELLLPPLGRRGSVWAAVGCDSDILNNLAADNEMTIKEIPYTEYRSEYVRATSSGTRSE